MKCQKQDNLILTLLEILFRKNAGKNHQPNTGVAATAVQRDKLVQEPSPDPGTYFTS